MKSSISFDRPLQGQSPYIVNVGLYYNEPKTKLSLVYNVIGKRIVAVGRPSPNEWESIPDIYEMPRHEVDLMATRSLGKHLEVKFGIKNILNTKTNYQQNINTWVDISLYGSEGMKYFDRTQLVKSYQQGIGAIINLSYKF
jgi:outer membrane receptor protein involved in Fe transport